MKLFQLALLLTLPFQPLLSTCAHSVELSPMTQVSVMPSGETVLMNSTSTPFVASSWTGWESLGSGVSVSYNEVSGSSWTWKFRNDRTSKITYLDFYYRDSEGSHTDTLPGSLDAGEVFGGWSAFTASSQPSITIRNIVRK